MTVGLVFQAPLVWAQPLEVVDVDTTRAAVETQVERLVTELQTRDPELAQEIERQAQLCERDMRDGQLDHEGFTRDIESFREVREMMGREELGRPTPETMERMQTDMEHFLAERPELAEYARAEFSEFARETAERFGHETGEHGAEMEHMQDMMREMGGPEMFREMAERGMMEHEFERYAHEFEREYGAILDNRAEFFTAAAPPPEGGGGGEGPHTFVQDLPGADSAWDGNDADASPDHTHPDGFGPHNGP